MEKYEQITSTGANELEIAQEQKQPDLQASPTVEGTTGEQTEIAVDAQAQNTGDDAERKWRVRPAHIVRGVGALVLVATAVVGTTYVVNANTPLANNVQTAPAAPSTTTDILTSPVITTPASKTPEATPTPVTPTAQTTLTTAEAPKPPAEVAPAAPTHLVIPKLGIDANIQPVSSVPTGEKNAMGGDVYAEIEFPLDMDARYWVQGGLPNTVVSPDMTKQPEAGLRTIIYGHASDIGNTWLFQHLADMQIDDVFTMSTATHTFTYKVTKVATPAKDALKDDIDVYGLPEAGKKEVALVGCYPEKPNHAIVIAEQVSVAPLGQ